MSTAVMAKWFVRGVDKGDDAYKLGGTTILNGWVVCCVWVAILS
jgi:hypothetical protein